MLTAIILSLLVCMVFDSITCVDWDKRGYRRERLVVQAIAHVTIFVAFIASFGL